MAFPQVWLPHHPQTSHNYTKGATLLAERLRRPVAGSGPEEGWLLSLAAPGWAHLPLQEHLHRLAQAHSIPPLAVWADWHVLRWSGARSQAQSRLPRWQALLERAPWPENPRDRALAYLDRWALAQMEALLDRARAPVPPMPPPFHPPSSPWAEVVRWAWEGPPMEGPLPVERTLPEPGKSRGPDPRPLLVELAAHHQAWDWAHDLAVGEPALPMAAVPLVLRGLLGLDPDGCEGALAWYLWEPPPLAVEGLAVGPARVHLQVLAETDAGLQIQVVAETPLYLEMVTATHHFSEAIAPGRHRYRLTLLDRTDWTE